MARRTGPRACRNLVLRHSCLRDSLPLRFRLQLSQAQQSVGPGPGAMLECSPVAMGIDARATLPVTGAAAVPRQAEGRREAGRPQRKLQSAEVAATKRDPPLAQASGGDTERDALWSSFSNCLFPLRFLSAPLFLEARLRRLRRLTWRRPSHPRAFLDLAQLLLSGQLT